MSEREAEVLALLGEHLTNAEIAARLYISVRTVESHVSSLLRKLGVADRRALAMVAAGSATADDEQAAPARREAPAPRPRLPVPLTSFVGRTAERAELAQALDRHRLVTAVGPGGVGKTRLALAVAADVTDRYADGAWYVDLVPVADPSMLGAAVAAALGFGEQLGRSPADTVTLRLAGAEALLVLDNCEHLLDAAAELVERLLTACPRVTVLATSRARLGLPFEWTFAVPGLSLAGRPGEREPSTGGAGEQGPAWGDAVALFLDRAAMVGWSPHGGDDLARVAEICDALDGSALAIELAAARLATRGLDGLEAGLGNPLGLLTGGSRLDRRHRSLRSALDWSYQLLDPVDQAVLRQASVFAGPFTAAAATQILVAPAPTELDEVADALDRLAGQSLLVVLTAPDGTRYRMLETIRQHGGEQLEQTGERAAVHGRHLAWCQRTASVLAAADAAGRDGFAADADELRAALHWAAGQPERRADAHGLALLLADLAYRRRRPNESQRHYEQAAALAPDDGVAADVLLRAAEVAMARLAGDDALRLFRSAAEAARRNGDPRRAALDLLQAAELIDRNAGLLTAAASPTLIGELVAEARALAGDDVQVLAAVRTVEAGKAAFPDRSPTPGDERPGEERARQAVELARQVGDVRLESAALDQLTVHQLMRGGVRDAAATSRRRLDLLAGVRRGEVPDPTIAFELSDALHMAAYSSIGAGDLAAAQRYAEPRRELPFHDEDHLVLGWPLVKAALAGELDQAVALGERLRAAWERAGRPRLRGFAVAPAAAAMAAGLRGDAAAEREWLDVHVQMASDDQDGILRAKGYRPLFEAIVTLHRGPPGAALAAVSGDPEALRAWHTVVWRQWYAAVWAEAAVLAARAGDDRLGDVPGRLARARSLAAENPLAAAIVDRAAALAAGEPERLVAIAERFAPECPYQRARTLVLAGGAAAEEGRRQMAALHAAPMVEP